MDSVSLHTPYTERIVVLCEQDYKHSEYNFRLMMVSDIGIPRFETMAVKYTQVELLTAIKPFAFKQLFEEGFERIVYLDPDIYTYGDLGEVLSKLDDNDILLTPHLVTPITHNQSPSEQELMQSGTYNLGFLGLAKSDNSGRLLNWWGSHLEQDCVIDKQSGLFVDQKWMDLVPGLFSKVGIVRDPGWNVAYWNLKERSIEENNGRYTVNQKPLLFFHFSGIRPRERIFSAHENPFSTDNLLPPVKNLVRKYMDSTEGEISHYDSKITFDYSKIDGTEIPDIARFAYRRYLKEKIQKVSCQTEYTAEVIVEILNSPIEVMGFVNPLVTRLSYEIYRRRPDLQKLYPNVPLENVLPFSNWFVSSANREYMLPEIFVEPIRQAKKIESGAIKLAKGTLLNALFRIYDNSPLVRRTAHKLTGSKIRNAIKDILIR